jgi:DNA-binding transcriptional MerR regulator
MRSRAAARLAPSNSFDFRMAETSIALLRAHARHAPWNARGLASHVSGLVDAAGVRPTNASARMAPTARSIRFYIANGLLDRPVGAGTAATYNYRHFLQLLAIKIRQREGATLDMIKKEMHDLTGDALERRVATSLAAALGAHTDSRPGHSEGAPATNWRRIAVADGVELHVRDDSTAAHESSVLAMREAARAALARDDR